MNTMRPLQFQRGIDAFMKHLPEKAKIVDIDIDKALYTKLFLQYGYEITAFSNAFPEYPNTSLYRELVEEELKGKVRYSNKHLIDTVIPYRTIDGIWIQKALAWTDPHLLSTYLSMLYDWLVEGGIMYLCVREGEGIKSENIHAPTGMKKHSIHYYQPEHLDIFIRQHGLLPVEAWFEGSFENKWIHTIIKRV